MRTIQQAWAEFERDVMPPGAPAIQRQEMRRAFYAGAAQILFLMVEISDDSISEDAGVLMFDNLLQEAKAFADRVGVDA